VSSVDRSLIGQRVYCNAVWLLRPIEGHLKNIISNVVIIQASDGCYGIKVSDITELQEVL
jgi:hypothetical protein